MKFPLFLSRLIADVQRTIIRLLTQPTHALSYSKTVRELANRPYTYVVVRDTLSDGRHIWMAYHPDFKDCYAQGDTPAQAVYLLDDVRQIYIEHSLEFNLPIPNPYGDYDAIYKKGYIIGIRPDFKLWDDIDHKLAIGEAYSVGADVTYEAVWDAQQPDAHLDWNVTYHQDF